MGSKKELIIKLLPYLIRGGNPVAKGLCYDTYSYSNDTYSGILLTTKYFNKLNKIENN